ncbi:MAG: hypothetical protein ACI4CS_09425 [Candidatus Weimeria sp.]
MDNKNSISTPASEAEKLKKASDEEVKSASDKFLRKNRKIYEELGDGKEKAPIARSMPDKG